jgi:hypothetical protein
MLTSAYQDNTINIKLTEIIIFWVIDPEIIQLISIHRMVISDYL